MALQNTFGEIMELHSDAITQEYNRYKGERKMLKAYVKEENIPGQPYDGRNKRFMYFTFVPYCDDGIDLVPAEISIVVFSALDGVIDKLTSMIDPGRIPLGQRGEVMKVCGHKRLPLPDQFDDCDVASTTPDDVLYDLNKFAEKYGLFTKEGKVMIFGMHCEILLIEKCMRWLIRNRICPGSVKDFSVLSFEMLCLAISRLHPDGKACPYVIQHEGGAAKFIYHTRYDFCKTISCAWHSREENEEKVQYCATNISHRRVYNILFYFSHLFQFIMQKKLHEPPLTTNGDDQIPQPIRPFENKSLVAATCERGMQIQANDNHVSVLQPTEL